ncbi:MAG: LLM class flavin-dependent oxidoreductase [Gammaproteobacteria bacterium]
MRFGLFFLPSFDAATHTDARNLYEQILEQTELAEALGLDSVWCAEHHFCAYGGDIPNPPLMLAAMAQRTERIRLGTAGVALPVNRPLNTAEQLAMVDNLCGGRLDIGVVRAFMESEYRALQVSMDESRERFNEGLEILRGTFANERFSYDGRFNRFEDVELRPRPVQSKPRIVVGSVMSPESIINAGRRGLDLMVIPYAVSLDKVRDTISLYHDALADGGHDPADHTVMGPLHLFVDTDGERACSTVREPIVRYVGYLRDAVLPNRWSKDYQGYDGMAKMIEALMDFDVMYDQRSAFGHPDHASECIEAFAEVGIGEIPFITIMPGLAQERILDSLRCFAAEVMPRFTTA